MQGVSLLHAENQFEASIVRNVQAAVYTFLKEGEDPTRGVQEVMQETLERLVSDSIMSIQRDMRGLMLQVMTPCTRRQSELLPIVADNLQLSATKGEYPPTLSNHVVDAVIAVGHQSKAFARLGRGEIPAAAGAPARRHAAAQGGDSSRASPRSSAAFVSGASGTPRRGSRLASGAHSATSHSSGSVKSLPLQCLKVFLDTDWFLDSVLRESLDLVLEQAYDRVQHVAERLIVLCDSLPEAIVTVDDGRPSAEET